MPLALDYEQTASLYKRCADADLTMPRIGYSDQDQIYGIVRGAAQFAKDHSIDVLPIGIFATVGHYIFQQLPRYLEAGHRLPSEGGDRSEWRRRITRNARLAVGFMRELVEEGDPDFGRVWITHHYDHGHHTLPGGNLSPNELLRDLELIDLFSSVMFDDSHSPFAANVENSIAYKSFLEENGRRKVLEGCLEEVAAAGKGRSSAGTTDPGEIEAYLERTGFDLVVPSIGTESIHARQVGVDWSSLEELHRRGIGKRLAVHGFSSVRKLPIEEQRRMGELGCVAMNAWSYIPQTIGPELLARAKAILESRDAEKGYAVGFTKDGEPIYDPSNDANIFFGPILDQVRDLKVRRIAESVYEILDNLGFAKLGS
ncbi:MAG TPA: class II fructose-bisphosphate aldolase [Planctomycetota bacterium]|nr:class II fructose-bisphosphate aldolase [Planctomycetota bacterium]